MLYEIMYASHAEPGFNKEDVLNLVSQAKANNSAKDITGALWFDGAHFVQILEGQHEDIVDLFSQIKSDPRHDGVLKFYEGVKQERLFPQWSMAFQLASNKSGFTSWAKLRQFVSENANEHNFSVTLLNHFFDALLPHGKSD